MLKRTKSTLVLHDSFSSSVTKKNSIFSQESNNKNNITVGKPTFKLSEEGSFETSSPKMSSIFSQDSSNFLKACGLCRKKLSPEKNIYMYRGDQAFCSDSCRCRKILIEELLMEETEEETTIEVPNKDILSSSPHFATNIGNGLQPRQNHVRAAA
ncbi:hypothetical protein MKW98_024544 [Papaver atlanticum]|uniref:FLZ-type domain-containing protein n=1 Tax=Papaver atlanticum TaxID=357466 RepID=A0AAD4X351_9MAGN|nr:hypothetical protein MKW98_024544 [Papaver atlanticum]